MLTKSSDVIYRASGYEPLDSVTASDRQTNTYSAPFVFFNSMVGELRQM
jgi:hypothetical protein